MVATPTESLTLPSVRSRAVPSSLEQIFKLTRAQLREYFTSRRYLILVAIVVLIAALVSFVVAHYHTGLAASGGPLSTANAFYGSFWAGGVPSIIVLAAVFFGGDAIAGEFQNKTGYFLMGLPIRRVTVYIGKFIAAFTASLSIVLLWLALMLGNGAFYFGDGALPWQLAPSILLAILYLLAVLGSTFLFSSLFKTSAYGFVLTAILFLLGFALLQDLVQSLVKTEPWMVISYASSAIGNVFAPTINWGIAGTVVTQQVPIGRGETITTTTYTAGVAEGVIIMLAYFVITGLLGLFLFEREEFA